MGLVAGLDEMGLSVPQDISIVGAVSSRTLGAMTNPPLSTSHAPGERMGAYAARALIRLIDGEIEPADCHELVACTAVHGRSMGPPSDAAPPRARVAVCGGGGGRRRPTPHAGWTGSQ